MATGPTAPHSHLAPSWLQSFTCGSEEEKHSLLTRFVDDWLHAHPPGVDHASAVVELLLLARESAARRSLIEANVSKSIIAALAEPPLQHAAASAAARLLALYPPVAPLLADRLCMALGASGRPAGLLDGLERLARLSPAARTHVFPRLLEASIENLLEGKVARDPTLAFDEVKRGMGDIARLRDCLAISPYKAVLDGAFATHATEIV